MRSMTGYGCGRCILYNRKFVVEIKSVNHRYNELSIRMPKVLNALEDKVRKKLLTEIHRGKTDVFIHFETFSKDDMKISFNETLCDAYTETFEKMRARYGLQDEISLALLSALPDVVTIEKAVASENMIDELWEALEQAVALALTGFLSMRETEGRNLSDSIAEKAVNLEEQTDSLSERAPLIVREYEQKLRDRLFANPLFKDIEIDQNRLITEITIFADRACVDEELTRLKSHLSQLRTMLAQGNESGGLGRKLDFLVQEMNREINTIGSKSNDLAITNMVVYMKGELEKIREQVQNVE